MQSIGSLRVFTDDDISIVHIFPDDDRGLHAKKMDRRISHMKMAIRRFFFTTVAGSLVVPHDDKKQRGDKGHRWVNSMVLNKRLNTDHPTDRDITLWAMTIHYLTRLCTFGHLFARALRRIGSSSETTTGT